MLRNRLLSGCCSPVCNLCVSDSPLQMISVGERPLEIVGEVMAISNCVCRILFGIETSRSQSGSLYFSLKSKFSTSAKSINVKSINNFTRAKSMIRLHCALAELLMQEEEVVFPQGREECEFSHAPQCPHTCEHTIHCIRFIQTF